MTDDQMNKAAALVADMKRIARYGHYDGFASDAGMQRYMKRCRRFVLDTGTSLLFTHDKGMHTSGWWKNPDYERCLHLSLSFVDPETGTPASHNHDEAKQWCRLFFDGTERLIWIEPPFSDHGKKFDVWHYRVFMAPDFTTPILPRGEVYSREFTESGWKSWSDVHGEPQEEAHT